MPSQIFTVLSAVVPALLVLLTEQVFNLIRDKRASRERLMYYFLPKRLEFYRGLLTFIAENLSRRKSAQFLSASDVQSEALDLNEEVIKLHTAAVCCASMSVASTPVLLSSGLLALQEECDHAPVDELVEEFRGLLSAAEQRLNVTLRKELHADDMDRIFNGARCPRRRRRKIRSVLRNNLRRKQHEPESGAGHESHAERNGKAEYDVARR